MPACSAQWPCSQRPHRRRSWQEQIEPFARDFTVVAVDLPGHGESGLTRTDWTIESFGADVAALVTELDRERVILIGHSMGGDVIVEAARKVRRGRIAGLIWVDTYKSLGTFRTAEQIQAFVAPFQADFVPATRSFVRGLFPANVDKEVVDRLLR